jgi:YesN/AraC family two-component response regulator
MVSESNTRPAISLLVVEDDAESREILDAVILHKFPGVVLHSAKNGRSGLELFTEHTPDIVITDINMPEMGGVQMAGKIRAIRPETKLIVISADPGKATLEESVGKGFEVDHCIMKPVDYQKLFSAIEQCIAEITPQQDS